ncbi:hypothetical protein BCD67_20330 [Oscillatoriales cyanobacterium USR001]|nr:hypothetical protein BCD67_20330 [Oscillatoriales cyanobacterium USR001]
MQQLKQLVRKLKQDIYTVYLASIDPRVPWYARFLAICVVAYAFSPIDLIPDFIPILGYLDDLLIVPCGIWLLLKIIPPGILADCREKAAEISERQPKNWVAAGVIIIIWFLLGITAVIWVKIIFKN